MYIGSVIITHANGAAGKFHEGVTAHIAFLVAAAVNAFAQTRDGITISADVATLDVDLGIGRDVGLLTAAHNFVNYCTIVDIDFSAACHRCQLAATIHIT